MAFPVYDGCNVNKSQYTFSVFDYINGNVIGTIYPNEAYAVQAIPEISGSGWYKCKFRNASGQKQDGVIYASGVVDEAVQHIVNYPHSRPSIPNGDGTWTSNVYAYIAQRNMPIYDPYANQVATVQSGMRVATTYPLPGDTNFDWIYIEWYETATNTWQTVAGSNYSHGFVPIGLEYGSMPSTVPIHGSW